MVAECSVDLFFFCEKFIDNIRSNTVNMSNVKHCVNINVAESFRFFMFFSCVA